MKKYTAQNNRVELYTHATGYTDTKVDYGPLFAQRPSHMIVFFL